MKKAHNPRILLSFDVEEFDIPEEYGEKISFEEQIRISKDGLLVVLDLLLNQGVRATFFTTARFALAEKNLIARIVREGHEIASHSYNHGSFEVEDIERSKREIEKLIGRKVEGFRMPRLAFFEDRHLIDAGYSYNSSLNPTLLPGRYNNLRKPASYYIENGLINLPISVTPRFRIPLFWLTFKNIPFWLYSHLAGRNLEKIGYFNVYFHPWEFADISKHKLPYFIKKVSGERLRQKLIKLIAYLKRRGDFVTAGEFCETLSKGKVSSELD